MAVFIARECLPTPTLGVDPGGNIVFANRAFRTMVGYSLDELGAMTFGELLASHRADCPLAKLYAYAEELVALSHKDGHVIWVRASRSSMHPQFDSWALIVFEDRTEALRRNEIVGHHRGSTARPRCCRR